MPVIRNKLSSTLAGGPRQYAELQDKLLIRVESRENIQEVRSELDSLGLTSRPLQSTPVLTAQPRDRIEDVLNRAAEKADNTARIRRGIKEVSSNADTTDRVVEATKNIVQATQNLLRVVSGLRFVSLADFIRTEADFGPENLRLNVDTKETLSPEQAKSQEYNPGEVNKALGLHEAWQETKGGGAISVIFDTGFSEGLIAPGRIRNTFHAGGTDSVFESSEGHGTMTAGAMAANRDEGVPFNGAAPESEVILVRVTDSKGQIRSDITADAWDWVSQLDPDKPMVINHSYGTPLCSGRTRNEFCNTPINDVINAVNEQKGITSVYAAGNEAMRCGHRPGGFTSAVTGTNSLPSVITVGALLSTGREAQRYSSHGRGDCAPIADPKPNISCRLPLSTYYGTEEGWEVKDMSTGLLGSGGGTSNASPRSAGCIALMQSKAYQEGGSDNVLQTEEIKQIVQKTAKRPRRTQINMFGFLISQKGYDARFGNGEINIAEAIKEV